ncbi:MAG TPA: SMP-30/gluconolactonase/LRE family protein [Ilumatobacter sp.]|nr:SMP-30/gluconolactonase/LRE family protein [Ilumatobacter sp.]
MAIRAPLPAEYDIVDDRFLDLIDSSARLHHLADGCLWAEGPVYIPAADVVQFSDVRNNRRLQLDCSTGAVSVVRDPSEYSNGHTIDHDGVVIACEHATRSVRRLLPDGNRLIIADRFEGKRFNSPNDVVVADDGAVWFTDPTYGIDSNDEGYAAESEIGSSNVYRVDAATGTVTAEVTDMVRPNGLAFSLDARSLYVADTGVSHVKDGPRHIRRYDVSDGHIAGGGEVFATCPRGAFDGFRLDAHGRIWASGATGVHCYLGDGTLLGTVLLPEICANVEFGGSDRRTLYMTATTSLYAIDVGVEGAPRLPAS